MDACAVALAPPSAHRRPMTGADLHGWSALPLLGSASDDSRRWLFVATRSLARLSGVPLAGAQFTATVADYGRAWPFPDDALGGVVIDGDALARGATEDALHGMLAEARRVSGGRGTVLVVCAHRLVPRRLRAWREYGRRSAQRWQRAAAAAGLQMRKTGFVRLDGERVTDMTVCRGDRPAGSASNSTSTASPSGRSARRRSFSRPLTDDATSCASPGARWHSHGRRATSTRWSGCAARRSLTASGCVPPRRWCGVHRAAMRTSSRRVSPGAPDPLPPRQGPLVTDGKWRPCATCRRSTRRRCGGWRWTRTR